MPLEELPAKIVPFKSRVYQVVNAKFGPIIKQKVAAGKLADPWWGFIGNTGDEISQKAADSNNQ